MRRSLGSTVDTGVFGISLGISVLFVLWGVFFTDSLSAVASAVLGFLIEDFGWVFILSTFGFLVFVVYLAFSRYGKIKLGRDEDEPEFNTVSWVAMMFSVGMGIGLMFYGVAEPISHYSAPPHGLAKPETAGAAQVAMEYSYFHWALHPWAIYAVVGLALAYFTFRKGKSNLISSAFTPILGDRVEGPIGKAIDILAIFATLFGTATSLGLGALQITGGLNYLNDSIPADSISWAMGIIAFMTVAFILSAVSGVHRGIQWLSNVNMVLAVVLVLFLVVVGPTVFIFNTFTESVGGYFANLIPMSFRTAAFGDADWLASWTIFYWAWWISWTPFVGTFIARISKGRTIREFVLGVLVVPSLVTFVWFGVLGGSALNLSLGGDPGIVDAVSQSPAAALFATLNEFPLAVVMSVLAMVLVALFFISGADAGAVVMGMLSSRGVLEPNRMVVVIWGVLAGSAAAICLLANGLEGLQTAAIISAAPFVLVMIGLCYSLFKELRTELLPERRRAPEPERAATRPTGAPAPQQMRAERDPGER
ncbi:MAG TPA: BCCT family transporter [Rubrobacter sp.]|nr:BCCT family transporter [Rubrobacter sp.]